MCTETPSAPRNLVAKETCNSITLEWEVPERNGGLEISSYNVRLTRTDDVQLFQQSAGASKRKAKIDYPNFEPQTAYKVYLTAQNDVGYGQEEMVEVTTKQYCEYNFWTVKGYIHWDTLFHAVF